MAAFVHDNEVPGSKTNVAIQTLEGWYAWHEFRCIDWRTWKATDGATRLQAINELVDLGRSYQRVNQNRTGSHGQYLVVGSKADILFLHLRPTLVELQELKEEFQKTRFADFTRSVYSYISVVELSSYTVPQGVYSTLDDHMQAQLQPELPSTQHVCFYPMNKRRSGNENWYTLSVDERREMMHSHGLIGRSYAGKVKQLITGSVGLDDWEWGVTLFAEDPLQFKKIVYEMRFDEVSARYGDFGAFYVGNILTESGIERLLSL